MRPIEKTVKKFEISTNSQRDQEVLNELLRVQADSKRVSQTATGSIIWKTFKFAAAAVVVTAISLACWFAIGNTSKPKQQSTQENVVAITPETPAKLTSVISLNMAFRNGGMKAVETQFAKAEKKIKPGLKERITIDQLMCELGECEKI
jgi:hypothetical protein